MRTSFLASLGLVVLALAAAPARADGLADLKAALSRLQGPGPVKGQVDLVTKHRVGEGSDSTETRAQAVAGIEDGPRGLQLTYGRELLARAEEERRAKVSNPEAKTPSVDAMSELGASDLLPLATAGSTLQRAVEHATFVGEKAQAWKGKPARLLSFATSIDTLSARDRKYVKNFEGTLDVWIGADGTPLASRTRHALSGRAYVVVSFQMNDEEEQAYAVSGDRLVTMRRDLHRLSSGAGERDERSSTASVQWGG